MKKGWYRGSEYPYFLTNTVVGWKPVFTVERRVRVVTETFKFYRLKKKLSLLAFVVMPTHLHYIVSFTKSRMELSDFQRDFKKWISRQIFLSLEEEATAGSEDVVEIFRSHFSAGVESPESLLRFFQVEGKKVGQGFKLWMTDEHPTALVTSKFFNQKLVYIHNNPVSAGFVDYPYEYPFSSARNYELDDQSFLEIDWDLLA